MPDHTYREYDNMFHVWMLLPIPEGKRARAETALGEDFDIRHFHEQVLDSGNIPLTVLEAKIDDWIAAGRDEPVPSTIEDPGVLDTLAPILRS